MTGPSVVYGRTYSPALPAAAGLQYRTGFGPPIVVPNYATSYYGPGAFVRTAPTVPYGTVTYGPLAPGYTYNYGANFARLGYGYGYPGSPFVYGQAGTLYPMSSYGYVAPSWPYQQMQGYWR